MPCRYIYKEKKKCQFPQEDIGGPWFGDWCLWHSDYSASPTVLPAVRDEIQRRLESVLFLRPQGSETLDLTGASIPDGVVLRGKTLPNLVLDGARIRSSAFLKEIKVLGNFSATEALFPVDADFSGSNFEGVVDLTSTQFERSFNLSSCTFAKAVLLNESRITGNLNISNSQFHGALVANKLTVAGTLIAKGNTKHYKLINLQHAALGEVESLGWSFLDNADFNGSTVSRLFNASSSQFSNPTSFANVKFLGGLDMMGSRFSGLTSFSGAEFRVQALFEHCSFNHDVHFDANESDGSELGKSLPTTSFDHATFTRACRFTNRKFLTSTKLNVQSFGIAPDFHGCEIHQDTQYPSRSGFLDTRSSGAARAYRTLKLACESHRARQEESMFFALEQDSLRHDLRTSRWNRFLLTCYKWVTNYGQSSLRALVAFFSSTIIFALAYAAWASDAVKASLPISWTTIGKSIILSLEQAVNPFWIFRSDAACQFVKPSSCELLRLVAAVQSVMSLTIVALFLLALRWRFKRD